MVIFQSLEHSQEPHVVKGLNQLLKFTARLVEINVSWEFIEVCVDSDRYQHSDWKSLRRSRIYPNGNTPRSYAFILHGTMCLKSDEPERDSS